MSKHIHLYRRGIDTEGEYLACDCGYKEYTITNKNTPRDEARGEAAPNSIDQILSNFARRIGNMPPGKTYGWDEERKAIEAIIGERTQKLDTEYNQRYDLGYADGWHKANDRLLERESKLLDELEALLQPGTPTTLNPRIRDFISDHRDRQRRLYE